MILLNATFIITAAAAVSVAESYYYNVTTTTGFFCVLLIPVVQLWYWPLFITFDYYGLQIHWYQLFVIINSNTNENCSCAVVIDQTIYPQYSQPLCIHVCTGIRWIGIQRFKKGNYYCFIEVPPRIDSCTNHSFSVHWWLLVIMLSLSFPHLLTARV